MDLSRRDFVKTIAAGTLSSFIADRVAGAAEGDALARARREARFYEKLDKQRVRCHLCPRECVVADMERGACGDRENRGGTYYTLVYGALCAEHVDPIEKKPMFHYLPGTTALSVAAPGCNMECKFCQNWRISQFRPEQIECVYVSPRDLVALAKRYACPTIAHTYTEPVVFTEYVYDTAKAARAKGVGTVMISNGYILREPMEKLCDQLTGVKIDLKAFTEKFYKEVCSGTLAPVLDTLKTLKRKGMWFEIVVLIVPTLNDSEGETRAMSRWILNELGPDVPVHFTRFHPEYKLRNLYDTPVKTIERAREIAMDIGLHYVYVGNVWGNKGENTFCPKCKRAIIRRIGFRVLDLKIKDGKCAFCGEPIPGVWKQPV